MISYIILLTHISQQLPFIFSCALIFSFSYIFTIITTISGEPPPVANYST